MADNDHLSNEFSIEVQITKSGLSVKVKSRTFAAFDRLVGSALDVPAAKMEALAGRTRNRGRLESAVYDAAIERVAAGTDSDADTARLVDEVLASQIRALANKKHVAERAVEHLASPSSDREAEPTSDPEEVDPDWLNYFGGHAEKASSERIRDLWARVLAGEIRRPGSFSLTTLRFLAELDQQMASWFEAAVKFRFQGSCILRPDEVSGKLPDRLGFLQEVGLIQHLHPASGIERRFEPGSNGSVDIFEGDLCLSFRPNSVYGVALPVIAITRIGQEIARILPPVDQMAVLRRVGAALLDEVECMDICRVVSRHSGNTQLSTPIEVLKSASVD